MISFHKRVLTLFSIFLLASLCSSALWADPPKRPKIGLALSGGGARGFAHIGVLQALEKMHIPIDYIAGTSMGSVVGGLYASGLSTQALQKAVQEEIDWEHVFESTKSDRDRLSYREKQNQRRFFLDFEVGLTQENITAPAGLINGQNMFLILKRLTRNIHVKHFSELPIAFKAVATDLNSAQPYLLEKGDLALALRASMAVPFAFSPVEIDGHLLADGGILNNLPVDVVKAMGAEVVIAVNISTPLGQLKANSSFLAVAQQAIDTALIQNTLNALNKADIVITPDIESYRPDDFSKAAELIAKGVEAIENKKILLKGLTLSTGEYANYQAGLHLRMPATHEAITPSFVEVTGHQRASAEGLLGKLENLVGKRLNTEEIEQATQRIMSLNDFEQVDYQITHKPAGETGLTFKVREKPWGPDYVRFGGSASTSFDNKTEVSALLRHERLNVNALGAEWVNELTFGSGYSFRSEFFQPLDYQRRFYIMPYTLLGRSFRQVFEQQRGIAEYNVQNASFGVDVGMHFSNVGNLYAGLRRNYQQARVQIGDNSLPNTHTKDSAFIIGYGYDDLDDRLFARRGLRLTAQAEFHQQQLHAADNYQKFELHARHHKSLSPEVTLLSEFNLGSYFNSQPPPYENFTLGGINGLAGYALGDMGGKHALLIRMGGLVTAPSLLKFGLGNLRLLALAHAGNAWDYSREISLKDLRYGGLGAVVWDTRFGSLLLGTGYTRGGQLHYALSLGSFF